MAEVLIIGPILTALLVILVLVVVFKLGKSAMVLVVNSVIGLVALLIVNLLPIVNVTINIWSILIVALGGLLGLALVIALSLLHIAF